MRKTVNPLSFTDHNDLSLNTYIAMIRSYKVLSEVQVQSLVEEVKTNGANAQKAKDALVCSNLRLVIKLAKLYQGRGLTMVDLIEEGNIGLIKAIDTYNPEAGVKFSSYAASVIKSSFLAAIESYGSVIRFPHNVETLLNKYRKYADSVLLETGHKPTAEQFADFADVAVEKAQFVMSLTHDVASFSTPRFEDEDGETLGDSFGESDLAYEDVDKTARRAYLDNILCSVLSERERDLLYAWSGMFGYTVTMTDMLDRYGLNEDSARKVRCRAINKIKKRPEIISLLMQCAA